MEEGLVQSDDTFCRLIKEKMYIEPPAEAKYYGARVDCLLHTTQAYLVGMGLMAWRMLYGGRRAPGPFWPDSAYIIFQDGISAFISKFLDLFQDTHTTEMFFANQITYLGPIRVEFALSSRYRSHLSASLASNLSSYSITANPNQFSGSPYRTILFKFFSDLLNGLFAQA